MRFPKQVTNLTEALERLPGIGAKTAQRLTFYLLHVPQGELAKFADSLSGLKEGLYFCAVCRNISETEVCEICADDGRDRSVICVVEQPLDVFSLEGTGKFKGLYHVLHGLIDPLRNIGPEELYVADLVERVSDDVDEVILALNPTMEGEATAMYVAKLLREKKPKLAVTKLGVGMPIGGDLQYADETTLSRALEGRRSLD